MTANHEHTPSTEQVRMDYIQASEGDRVYPEESGPEFDRWLATVVAAAEQRGAIKALRDGAESPDLIGHMYREYDEHPLRSTLAPAAVRATATYLHNRANLLEGDDETH